jgi:hypothetical protein
MWKPRSVSGQPGVSREVSEALACPVRITPKDPRASVFGRLLAEPPGRPGVGHRLQLLSAHEACAVAVEHIGHLVVVEVLLHALDGDAEDIGGLLEARPVSDWNPPLQASALWVRSYGNSGSTASTTHWTENRHA